MRRHALAWLSMALVAATGPRVDGLAVRFGGRVVEATPPDGRFDLERVNPTGVPAPEEVGRTPIVGAAVVVRRSVPGGRTADETVRTGPDGRFEVAFPPEEVAEPRLRVGVVRVEHPGFVALRAVDPERQGGTLAGLIEALAVGDDPTLGTFGLARGVEVTGQFVGPDGRPAAGLTVVGLGGGWGRPVATLEHDATARTDADGRFRIRVDRGPFLALYATPDRWATYRHAWGPPPGVDLDAFTLPADLGRLTLETGEVVSGRLVDATGRLVAGKTLDLEPLDRNWAVPRRARTDGDGRFRFEPVRAGNHTLIGGGQRHVPPCAGPVQGDAALIRPVALFLKRGGGPVAVEVREAEPVRVEVRFVDRGGRPVPGCLVDLAGVVPTGPGVPRGVRETLVGGLAPDLVNADEVESVPDGLGWNAQGQADADGRAVVRAPRGMILSSLTGSVRDERARAHYRVGPSGGEFEEAVPLGTLDGEARRVEATCVRAATVLITPATEAGEPWAGELTASSNVREGYGVEERLSRQADGRYRGRLAPDREYTIDVDPTDESSLVLIRPLELRPAEGERVERAILLDRPPTVPKVGDLAPPFLTRGLHGRPISLADFRGRHLLLHFWAPNRPDDTPRFKALIADYRADPKVAALGLIIGADRAEAAESIETRAIDWPQALLPGEWSDPAVVAYGWNQIPGPVLIGPDGRVVAWAARTSDGWEPGPIRAALDAALGRPAPAKPR